MRGISNSVYIYNNNSDTGNNNITYNIYIYTYYIILYHIPKKVVYHHWVYSCTKNHLQGRYSNPPNVALSNHSSHVVILAPIVVLLPHTSCSILQGPKPPSLWTTLELWAHAADISVVSTSVRCECLTWQVVLVIWGYPIDQLVGYNHGC